MNAGFTVQLGSRVQPYGIETPPPIAMTFKCPACDLHTRPQLMYSSRPRLEIAIVAPSRRILGGQAIQAERLLASWRDDPDVRAWLVPINPDLPRLVRPLGRVKYVRTALTQLTYWPLLIREMRRADVVHVFSASY